MLLRTTGLIRIFQAVVASGLGALYKSTGNRTLLNEAEISLDATIKYLTTDGVLRETCDDATNTTCNTDQVCILSI